MGLIGCGVRGRSILIEGFIPCRRVEFAAVCDIDDRQLAITDRYVCKKYRINPGLMKDYRRILDMKDVDLVAIAFKILVEII